MLLIATDEAGYGPKLGPLVIAATVWRIPEEACDSPDLGRLFSPLRRSRKCGSVSIKIDDSKAIYQSGSGLDALHAVVSASLHWCGRDETCLRDLLSHLCPSDLDSIHATPWLPIPEAPAFLTPAETHQLVSAWRRNGVELIDVGTRVITARSFNERCECGLNKADLLSQTSLELVRTMVDRHHTESGPVAVYCDRHGGRRYYAGLLQHLFPESWVHIRQEDGRESVYSIPLDDRQLEVHFTVKGDSFTPVALSSIHAKYLRERFMDGFNRYFHQLHRAASPLRPTAGYPGDADRFLADIAPIVAAEKIDPRRLVRCR